MNHSIESAALYNQTGASYLAANEINQAGKCFQTALEFMSGEADASVIDKKLLEQDTNKSASSLETDEYIYSKPFFFNPAASLSQTELAPFGAVILFNLALTHHQKRRIEGEHALIIALRLYDKCLSLLGTESTFDCSNIIIACIHNQAKIYEELFDYRSAGFKFQLLSDILQSRDIRTDTMDAEDLQNIILDIHFFEFPTCAAVA
jgi:tetratricopeptide (TPR) repeat protein